MIVPLPGVGGGASESSNDGMMAGNVEDNRSTMKRWKGRK